MIRLLTQAVFRCFWKLEKWTDSITGRAGPIFVSLASLLLLIAIITYFNVIFPLCFLQPDSNPLISILGLSISVYLATSTIIHYYLACNIPPGSTSQHLFHFKSSRFHYLFCKSSIKRYLKNSNSIHSFNMEILNQNPRKIIRYCQKCLKNGIKGPLGLGPIKPERAHHCRLCGVCQLKYDHHCPWINQCVGLGNERYFLLFLFYMTLSSTWVVFSGWSAFIESVNFLGHWPFWSPRLFVILTWVLSLAMAVTLGIMFGWQMLLITKNETTVEAHDNEYYQKLFASRNKLYRNPFDLGIKANLQQFFNIGPSQLSWYTVLIPIPVTNSLNGWNWPKRLGWENQEIDLAEELTDEDED